MACLYQNRNQCVLQPSLLSCYRAPYFHLQSHGIDILTAETTSHHRVQSDNALRCEHSPTRSSFTRLGKSVSDWKLCARLYKWIWETDDPTDIATAASSRYRFTAQPGSRHRPSTMNTWFPIKAYELAIYTVLVWAMDHSIQRLLNDKLYDRRKQGALEYG